MLLRTIIIGVFLSILAGAVVLFSTAGMVVETEEVTHSIFDPVTPSASSPASIDADVASVDADVASIDADVASIDADVASVDADVASVDTDVASVDADVDSVDADVDSVDADVASIDADVGGAAAHQTVLTSKNSVAEQMIDQVADKDVADKDVADQDVAGTDMKEAPMQAMSSTKSIETTESAERRRINQLYEMALSEAKKLQVDDMRNAALLEIIDHALDRDDFAQAKRVLDELSTPELRDVVRAEIGEGLADNGEGQAAFEILGELEVDHLTARTRLDIITALMATRAERAERAEQAASAP